MNSDKPLSLRGYVTQALRGKIENFDFAALEHVSFELKQGETLGFIGHNGAIMGCDVPGRQI